MKDPITYVVGAGGIGCVVAGWLRSKLAVTLVERNERKVSDILRNGLRVNQVVVNDINIINENDFKPQNHDTIYLCTKCYDNQSALACVISQPTIIPIQNGYCHIPFGILWEGIASFVAHCEPDRGEVRITRPGKLHFGWAARSGPRMGPARQHADGFTVSYVNDIRPIKAAKLMYNAAISPLAAAAGIDNGDLLADPLARKLFFALLQENYSILNTAGVPLGKVGPFHPRTVSRILRTPGLARVMAKFFVRSLRGTYCSMAGDIEKGRTELDNYNGHLLRLAEGKHDAPCNRAIMELIPTMTQPDRSILPALHAKFFPG